VSVVLDAGALTVLATQRGKVRELLQRGLWPPRVPSIVLTEALTGDHRRDFHANRLLQSCDVRAVDEVQARTAARLRTATGRAGSISVVDAVVVAAAEATPGRAVLTTDPDDLLALCQHTEETIDLKFW
jgi:predicted nucleic acid-binding protein